MFRRVFVANRGEVAARVVRACRALGIEPVCGASAADLQAGYPYLQDAAQVVRLGPGPAAQSYLAMESVVQAAVQSGCAALHPGWGFLAENARFAALCAQHGVIFIGPSPAAMERMGGKLSARAAARAAGLPVVPGSDGALADAEAAVRAADAVGYPVVLKADAGGGGRGIRRCCDAGEVRAAFAEAAREAEAAFGDASLYLEKYLEGGRHVEFQLLGDGRGAAIHLGERECSIQRRHQKLLEESPSPALDAATRARMGEACARAAGAWRYAGAGTMEFLLDGSGRLHFLEMNTRLQVEHPVTEEVTGLDLAQAQIRIAAGGGLPCAQHEVRWSGWAIEARINAEDPDDGFRPAPGIVNEFSVAGEGVRVDTHLAAGARIPPHYDSLIAKVIARGDDRAQAIARLDAALAAARVGGVPTTIGLQRRILAHADFRAGRCDTQWLEAFLS
jgi:acetyl-CoA carboxylase biotin carboxylase subunit